MNMFGKFFKLSASLPSAAPAVIREVPAPNGESAISYILQRAREAEAAKNLKSAGIEILDLTACDLTVKYEPSRYIPGSEAKMAADLESILQGAKVDKDSFQDLFKNGFVFKETGNKWGITEAGKQMVERNKLITEDACLVSGIVCLRSWKGTQA